jgi:dienelactone hydrolase
VTNKIRQLRSTDDIRDLPQLLNPLIDAVNELRSHDQDIDATIRMLAEHHLGDGDEMGVAGRKVWEYLNRKEGKQ